MGTGIASLYAASKGAYYNVLINVGGIKDEEYVKEKKTKADELMKQIENTVKSLENKILEQL